MAPETPATEPRLASDQHDAALALALGALSVVRSVDACMNRVSAHGSPPLDAGDPVVLAALGAISFGRSLTRWLEEAAQPQQRQHADAPTLSLPGMRELLR